MLPTLLLTTSLLLGAQWSSEWVPDPGHQPGRVTALAYGSMGATWIAYDRASGELALLHRENGWRVETAAQGPLEAFALAVTSPGAPVLAVAQGGEVFVLRRTGPASLEAFIERGSLLRALKEDPVVRKRFRGHEEALEAATTPGPLLAALGPGGAVGFAFHHFDMKANRVDVRVGYMRKVCSHCTVGIQERSLRVRPTAELRRALEQAAAGQGLFMTTPKAQRFPLALPENLLR
jgi:hypothetical protein